MSSSSLQLVRWRVLAVFFLFISICDAHILRLQFDGSLQAPSDPGFPALDPPIATAAASCQVANNNDNDNTLWMGGKVLPTVDNSAAAEYEGLLLGLEKAGEIMEQTKSIHLLRIQGDCKTVIDQLQLVSRPRKLNSYYEQAQGYLDKFPIEVDVEHIPREQNTLCDGLCATIRQEIIEKEAWEHSLFDLEYDTEDLQNIFHSIVKPTSCIPYSKRPQLYQTLVEKAQQQQRFDCLLEIGQHIEQEAKAIWSSADVEEGTAKQLQTQGIRYQLEGLHGDPTRQNVKLAMALERKHRYNLNKYPPEEDWNCLENKQKQKEKEIDILIGQSWLEAAKGSEQWKQEKCLWIQAPPSVD